MRTAGHCRAIWASTCTASFWVSLTRPPASGLRSPVPHLLRCAYQANLLHEEKSQISDLPYGQADSEFYLDDSGKSC